LKSSDHLFKVILARLRLQARIDLTDTLSLSISRARENLQKQALSPQKNAFNQNGLGLLLEQGGYAPP
jgi:hypothetical protein